MSTQTRIERDTMGEVHVPATAYWGAQTERSRTNFKIGPEGSMPKEIVHAFAYLKKAAALTNRDLGVLSAEKAELIGNVCDEILTGQHDAGGTPIANRQTRRLSAAKNHRQFVGHTIAHDVS